MSENSTAPLLDAPGKKFIHQLCGKFLFLGRAVDATLLCPISDIASQSATPTEDRMVDTKKYLDYVATQEEADTSATESELAALYITAREAVYLRIILEEMRHLPLQTDNAMAESVSNGKIQPKRTKAMDMRFHWLLDRECQK